MTTEKEPARPVRACDGELTAALVATGARHGVLMLLTPDGEISLSLRMSVKVAQVMPELRRIGPSRRSRGDDARPADSPCPCTTVFGRAFER